MEQEVRLLKAVQIPAGHRPYNGKGVSGWGIGGKIATVPA